MSWVVGTASHGREDRLGVFEYAEGLVLAVADGAGGTGNGAAAAEAVIAAIGAFGWSLEAARWAELLDRVDRSIAPGQSTTVVVAVGHDRIVGASVGDSEARWFGAGERHLTERQRRKPLLGAGTAQPVAFDTKRPTGGALVLGSDGLWKYVRRGAILAALARPPEIAARELVESVRYTSGAYPDDVSVIVCPLGPMSG